MWILKYIIIPLLKKIGLFFSKVFFKTWHAFLKYAWLRAACIFAVLAALFKLQHSKIGFFIGCKEYNVKYDNNFKEPCNLIFLPDKTRVNVQKKLIKNKKIY